MKTRTLHTKQKGFFSIGVGLALAALFGGATAVAVELNTPDDKKNDVLACSEYSNDYIVVSDIHCE